MKKIGILAFIGNGHRGGVSQYIQSLVDALSTDEEYDYVLFTDEEEKRFDNHKLEIRTISKAKPNIFEKVISVAQIFFGIRKPTFFSTNEINAYADIDMFICPAISPYPHFYLNKPFVLTIHDLQERYYPEYFTFKERITRYVLNKILSKSATHIICESNYIKADITKFLIQEKDKISIIQAPPPSEFVNFGFEENGYQSTSIKYNLPEKYLFYPAQFWYHKNHLKLLDAFKLVLKEHSNIHLVLTGAKQNNYNQVMSKISELNLTDRVLHLGYIDYEDLPYLYKMSQMLVMPTLFESVSIPIYEAFSLEVPVCSSNILALPEQVGDAGLLFDPTNSVDIANKIVMYLDDDNLRKEKAILGSHRVANFNHDQYKKRLLEMLKG